MRLARKWSEVVPKLERELHAARCEARHAQRACRELIEERDEAIAASRRMVQERRIRSGSQAQS